MSELAPATDLSTGVNVSPTRMRQGPSAQAKDTKVATKRGQSPRTARHAAPVLSNFRAFWPITDESVASAVLQRHAREDLPWLTAQAHAVIVGRGKWTIERSVDVPGSGRVTEWVLVFNAPAVEGRNPFADSKGEVA